MWNGLKSALNIFAGQKSYRLTRNDLLQHTYHLFDQKCQKDYETIASRHFRKSNRKGRSFRFYENPAFLAGTRQNPIACREEFNTNKQTTKLVIDGVDILHEYNLRRLCKPSELFFFRDEFLWKNITLGTILTKFIKGDNTKCLKIVRIPRPIKKPPKQKLLAIEWKEVPQLCLEAPKTPRLDQYVSYIQILIDEIYRRQRQMVSVSCAEKNIVPITTLVSFVPVVYVFDSMRVQRSSGTSIETVYCKEMAHMRKLLQAHLVFKLELFEVLVNVLEMYVRCYFYETRIAYIVLPIFLLFVLLNMLYCL